LTQWSATSRLELQTRVDGERKPTRKPRFVFRAEPWRAATGKPRRGDRCCHYKHFP
jgi:hypothetical protein